jgi:gamma-glutamylcyclotransferase (GGCT)/AIG2-like uncharacterized protein YtfP
LDNKYILVYGSLRKGDYNYDRFKGLYGSEFEYVSTMQIGGFDLYELNGDYPGVKRNELSNPLTVDIIKVSKKCYEQINSMEYYAGYYPFGLEVIDGNGNKYLGTIYIYEGEVGGTHHIPNGDWLNYKYSGE